MRPSAPTDVTVSPGGDPTSSILVSAVTGPSHTLVTSHKLGGLLSRLNGSDSTVSEASYAVQCLAAGATACDVNAPWTAAVDLAAGQEVSGLASGTDYVCFAASTWVDGGRRGGRAAGRRACFRRRFPLRQCQPRLRLRPPCRLRRLKLRFPPRRLPRQRRPRLLLRPLCRPRPRLRPTCPLRRLKLRFPPRRLPRQRRPRLLLRPLCRPRPRLRPTCPLRRLKLRFPPRRLPRQLPLRLRPRLQRRLQRRLLRRLLRRLRNPLQASRQMPRVEQP